MGPDTRLSRPTTIARDFPRAADQAPKPAAYVATISGVSENPTRPRMPETLTMRDSAIGTKGTWSAGAVDEATRARRTNRGDGSAERSDWTAHPRLRDLRDQSQLPSFGACHDGIDDVRVELRTLATNQLLHGHRHRHLAHPIRPIARDGIERVGRGHDPRLDRDALSGQTIGQALSVEPFVVPAYDVQGVRRVAEQRRKDPPTDHWMRHDVLVLLWGQRSGLVQHRFADADLADVVNVPAELDLPDEIRADAQLARKARRVRRDAHGVTARIRILGLQRLRQRLNPAKKELLEAALLRLDTIFEAFLIVPVFQNEPALFQRLRNASANFLELKWFDDVVHGPKRKRADGDLDVGVPRDHHNRHIAIPNANFSAQPDAAHFLHLHTPHHH